MKSAARASATWSPATRSNRTAGITQFEPPDAPQPSATTLSPDTSLDDLLGAILGDVGQPDANEAALAADVDAQVRKIREELNLPEPPPPEPVEFIPPRLSVRPPAAPEETMTIDVDAILVDDTVARTNEARTVTRRKTTRTAARMKARRSRATAASAIAGAVVVVALGWGLQGRTTSQQEAPSASPVATGTQLGVEQPRPDSPTFSPQAALAVEARTSVAPTIADREPRLIERVPPQYPPWALEDHVGGLVEVDIDIDATGRVRRALAVSGPGTLRDAAETAVLQWRYEPAIRDGAPAASRRRVRVSFSPGQ